MSDKVDLNKNYGAITQTSESVGTAAPVQTSTWTPVSTSLSFTTSSKASLGGFGQWGTFNSTLHRQHAGTGVVGGLVVNTASDSPDVFSLATIKKVTQIISPTSESVGTAAPVQTSTWTPVSTSLSFTTSSKASLGGFGQWGTFNSTLRRQRAGTGGEGGLADYTISIRTNATGAVKTTSSTIIGQADVTATAVRVRYTSASIVGEAIVDCSSQQVRFVTATLVGQGVVTTTPSVIYESPHNTTTGVGVVVASPSMVFYRTDTLTGIAVVTATAQIERVSEGWYQSGLHFSNGVNVRIAERFPVNEYLNGAHNLPVPSPMSDKRFDPSLTGYNFSYLNDFLSPDRFLFPTPSESFIEFKLFNTTTAWDAIAPFSGTLSGKTFQESTMFSFVRQYDLGVRHSPGTLADTGFECDGATSVSIGTAVNFSANLNITGVTNFSITPTADVEGPWSADGTGTMAITTNILKESGWTADGVTDVAISPAVNFAGILHIDGTSTVSVTGYEDFAGTLTMEAIGTCNFANTAQAYAVSLSMNATSSLALHPLRLYNGNLSMDGHTSWALTPNQDILGTVIFDQVDQEMNIISTFVLIAEMDLHAGSLLGLNSSFYPLGVDYTFIAINNDKVLETVDFTPIPPDNFTASLKTARSSGIGDIGRIRNAKNYGVSRDDIEFSRRLFQTHIPDEWVRFPFFVDSSLDIVQISDTLGFSASSIASIAGAGILGRIKDEYVTFAILTNVFDTQTNLEILATGNPPIRATQVVSELLWVPTSAALNTQTTLEVLYLANLAAIQQTAIESLAGGDPLTVLNQVAIEMLHAIHAETVVTQLNAEILQHGLTPPVDVTQLTVEVLGFIQVTSFSSAMINQAALECLANADSKADVQQIVTEVMHNSARKARINHEAIETMHNNDRNLVIDHEAIETIANSSNRNLVYNHIAIEILVSGAFDPEVASMVNNPHYHI